MVILVADTDKCKLFSFFVVTNYTAYPNALNEIRCCDTVSSIIHYKNNYFSLGFLLFFEFSSVHSGYSFIELAGEHLTHVILYV